MAASLKTNTNPENSFFILSTTATVRSVHNDEEPVFDFELTTQF